MVGDEAFFRPLVGGVLLWHPSPWLCAYLIIRAPARTLEITRQKIVMAAVLGAGIGFVVGLTSIGTGSLTIAGFLIFLRLPSDYVVGTTLVTAPVFPARQWHHPHYPGNVSWDLTGNLLSARR